ncbi:MAG: hypothetical protein VB101_11325 [Rhodospirillaceae bacterium]|nr:hypothetical protein [Rhodospirillaceae bacterium]
MFGIPIVLNPVYAVPFLLAPLLQILSAWAATLAGWLPITIQPVNWTMPVFLSGYVATGSNAGKSCSFSISFSVWRSICLS